MKLEHIGIAISDIESAKQLLFALFSAHPYKEEVVESEGIRTYFYDAGGVKLELLESISPTSEVARFLENHGQGLHHLAFSVDDASLDFERFKALGLRVLGDGPKNGADNKSIFFVHPKDTVGVLMEFCSNR